MKAVDPEIKRAFRRGRTDIAAFSREVMGVEPNPAQLRWYRYIRPLEDGWRWRYKEVIHIAANQIGKTLGIAILILWACNYKIGVESLLPGATDRDAREWNSRPYTWFHLAPSQQQAYIPLDDINLLIQGSHPAQDVGKEKYGLVCRWLPGLCQEVKVEQYYRGLSFYNGAVCQFRTTEDKAKALQGRRAAGISFDEVGFEDHLTSVVNETLMMRLIAMGGPLLMIGTPNGINDYYEFVQAITEATDVQTPELRVWVSERDLAVAVWSVVDDNVGYGLTREEVDRMEANLPETTKEQQLRGAFLEPAEAFFVPATSVLAAFDKGLPGLVGPKPGHRYVIFWDPSIASDPTACVVIDITTEPWRGVAVKHHKKPLGVNQLIQEITATHLLYNSADDPKRLLARSVAITAYDATSMGGQIIKQMLARIKPSRPLDFAGPSTKMDALTNLRAAMVGQKVAAPGVRPYIARKLILPDTEEWMPVKREVLNYRLKDDKITQDLVMALAGAVKVAAGGFSGQLSRPFDVGGRVTSTPAWR